MGLWKDVLPEFTVWMLQFLQFQNEFNAARGFKIHQRIAAAARAKRKVFLKKVSDLNRCMLQYQDAPCNL